MHSTNRRACKCTRVLQDNLDENESNSLYGARRFSLRGQIPHCSVFFFSPVKLFYARGKSEKSAREAQQLPVANQQIKKFHGQFGHIWGKFPWNVPFCPWQIPKKVPVKLNNCPWQIRKSKSFTGKKKFHGGRKKTLPAGKGMKYTNMRVYSDKDNYWEQRGVEKKKK